MFREMRWTYTEFEQLYASVCCFIHTRIHLLQGCDRFAPTDLSTMEQEPGDLPKVPSILYLLYLVVALPVVSHELDGLQHKFPHLKRRTDVEGKQGPCVKHNRISQYPCEDASADCWCCCLSEVIQQRFVHPTCRKRPTLKYDFAQSRVNALLIQSIMLKRRFNKKWLSGVV